MRSYRKCMADHRNFSTPNMKTTEKFLGRMLKKTVSEAAADGSTGGVASGLR
jgi:hypothetical protein